MAVITAITVGGTATTIRTACRRGAARIIRTGMATVTTGTMGRKSASAMATDQAIRRQRLAGTAFTAGIASMAARLGGSRELI